MPPRRLVISIMLGFGAFVSALAAPAPDGSSEQGADDARACVRLARSVYDRWASRFAAGSTHNFGVFLWSSRLLAAESALASNDAQRLAALEAHITRMRDLARVTNERVATGKLGLEHFLEAMNYVAEAESKLSAFPAAPRLSKTAREVALSRLVTARLTYEAWEHFPHGEQAGLSGLEHGQFWSQRWLEAEPAYRTASADRLAAAEEYLKRSEAHEALERNEIRLRRSPEDCVHFVVYDRAHAQVLVHGLKQSSAKTDPTPPDVRSTRREAAQLAYESCARELAAGRGDPELVYKWSDNWYHAAMATASDKAAKTVAAEGHASRMTELNGVVNKREQVGNAAGWQVWASEYYVAEARVRVSSAKAGR